MKMTKLNNGRYVARLDNGLAAGGWTEQDALNDLHQLVQLEYDKAMALVHMWGECEAEIKTFVEGS